MDKILKYKDMPLVNCSFNNNGSPLSAELVGDKNMLPALIKKLLDESDDLLFSVGQWINLRELGLKRPDTIDFINKTGKLSKSKLNYESDFDFYHFEGKQDKNIKTTPTKEEVECVRDGKDIKVLTRRIERTKILKDLASQNELTIFDYEPDIENDIFYYGKTIKNGCEIISFMEYFAYDDISAKSIIECCKENNIPDYANFFYDLCICDEIVDIEKTLNNIFVVVDSNRTPLQLIIL